LFFSRIDSDLGAFHLLEFVEFEYLSVDRISQFCTSHRHFFFQYLTPSVWSTHSRRLSQTPPKLTNPRLARSPAIDFAPVPGHPLADGIISHLTRHNGCNLHEAGIILLPQHYLSMVPRQLIPLRLSRGKIPPLTLSL
jgi:hypothetical protein